MSKFSCSIPLLFAAGLVTLSGCPPAPNRTFGAPIVRVEAPSVYLVSPKQKDAVRDSLLKAGFSIEDSHLATPHFLRVTIGSIQGSRDCGGLHNVRYELAIDGLLAIDLRDKGYLGTCEVNVLDTLSRELYERMALPPGAKGGEP